MDVHGKVHSLARCLVYCLLSALILSGCGYEVTIKKREGTSATPTDTARDQSKQEQHLGKRPDQANRPQGAAQCIITEAKGFIGAREKGANRGAQVEAIQREAGVPVGAAWCQAFVLVCYNRCAVRHTMDGRAASACKNIYAEAQPGDIICIDWNGDGKIQHSGIVEKDEGQRYVTIEGNTSDPDKAGGEGVYRKFRTKGIRHVVGRW